MTLLFRIRPQSLFNALGVEFRVDGFDLILLLSHHPIPLFPPHGRKRPHRVFNFVQLELPMTLSPAPPSSLLPDSPF